MHVFGWVPRRAVAAAAYAALAGLVCAAAACTRHTPAEMDEQAGPAELTVDNQEFPDADIFVVTEGGMRIRLGIATGHSVTSFEIPKSVVDGGAAHLYFIGDPIGGTTPEVGEMVIVNPGDEIELTLAPY